MSTIPYGEIDAKIRPLVRTLNEHGFVTTASCQGGPGHGFLRPIVNVAPVGDLDETRKALCRFLVDGGAHAFSASTVSMHQDTVEPEPYSYVQLELWTFDSLQGFSF